MSPETVITIGQQALWVTMMLASPLLLSALAVGLLVGMFQAATQINEMTMSFIPKLLVLVAALVVAGPWMLGSDRQLHTSANGANSFADFLTETNKTGTDMLTRLKSESGNYNSATGRTNFSLPVAVRANYGVHDGHADRRRSLCPQTGALVAGADIDDC